jgi:predicted GIY-YIG superfamily endonuclease
MSKSCVYFILLDQPIGNDNHRAQTYIGYAHDGDWQRRLGEHRSGKGSKMLAYAASVGINFDVVAVTHGDRKLERGLKNQGHGAKMIARICAGRGPAHVTYTGRNGKKEIIPVPAPIFVR